MSKPHVKPLGEILLKRHIVTEDQLATALDEQKRTQVRLGEALIALGYVTEEQITEARAQQLQVGYVNLQELEFDPLALHSVSESLARKYKLIPIQLTDDKVVVAMANPLDVETLDLIQFESKRYAEPVLATDWRIMQAIDREYVRNHARDLDNCTAIADDEHDLTERSREPEDCTNILEHPEQLAPVIRMVNLLLSQAVRTGVSDIHIEPRRDTVEIRFRIDGDLRVVKNVPRRLHPLITSRVKIMSELDIAERRLPQDGRITVRIDDRPVDLRVSTNPTIHGERIVLRILDRAQGLMPLDGLGFSEKDMQTFKTLVSRPYGIVLVTGPTGSGKTTTLYAALNMLKSERINIMTVEDPVEYELDGISQTMVHNKIGLTVASYLRTVLRQDPDVVLVGEIRDTETADIAFRAALTGHLVLSTLHCNDAPSAITRLLDMDVEPFLVSSAIVGAQAQRLVRILCQECKEAYKPDGQTKMILGLPMEEDVVLYQATGCKECNNTGYKGRIAISEIMVMNDQLRRLALQKAPSTDIRATAIEAGMTTMSEEAARKVLAGITTIDEIRRKLFFEINMDNGGIESSHVERMDEAA